MSSACANLWNVPWQKITEDGNSLQDKQWTPTGAGPMVPEEEEEKEDDIRAARRARMRQGGDVKETYVPLAD